MEERNLRKVMVGTVTSDKMDKTVVVSVETSVSHKMYGKTVKRTYKLKAHDEENKCEIGDKVKVMETKTLGLCPKPCELLKKFNQNFYQNAITLRFSKKQ